MLGPDQLCIFFGALIVAISLFVKRESTRQRCVFPEFPIGLVNHRLDQVRQIKTQIKNFKIHYSRLFKQFNGKHEQKFILGEIEADKCPGKKQTNA